jgi:hypothetical protein
MDNREHFHLIGQHVIHEAVVPNDDLTNVLIVDLGDDSTGKRKRAEAIRRRENAIR